MLLQAPPGQRSERPGAQAEGYWSLFSNPGAIITLHRLTSHNRTPENKHHTCDRPCRNAPPTVLGPFETQQGFCPRWIVPSAVLLAVCSYIFFFPSALHPTQTVYVLMPHSEWRILFAGFVARIRDERLPQEVIFGHLIWGKD